MPHIAVAGPSSVVTDAAIEVADEGGSVVDVAIVASLMAMCTEPGICGPGGGGFLTIAGPGVEPVVIDGYMAFPGMEFKGEPHVRSVEMTYGGGLTTLVDAGSVAVPGAFAAFDLASQMFGSVPWSVLMEAVARSVESGFPLSYPSHLYLTEGAAPIYQTDPVARDALFDGDVPKPLGSPIVFPGLGETLRHIGEAGAEDVYRGDVARMITDDLRSRGGQLTDQDMNGYRAIGRRPLSARMGEWEFSLNPEPAIGGAMVAAVLERLGPEGGEDAPALVRALVAAFEARRGAGLRSPSTISIAAGDDEGGAVAGSFSAGYGSGVIPAGTGMLMNNALGELELNSEITGFEPGERMTSNMAPTVAQSGDCSVAVGSPGADRITTAVATTLALIASGASLQQAIDHPRAHPELGDPDTRIAVEPALDIAEIEWPLRLYEQQHMYFGGVNGAGLLDGRLQAHADPRRTGSVAFSS